MVVKLLNKINGFIYPEIDANASLSQKVGSWVCTGLLALAIVDGAIAVGGIWYYRDNLFSPNVNKQQTTETTHSDYNSHTPHDNYNN